MVRDSNEEKMFMNKQVIEAIEIIAEETLIKGKNVNLNELVNNHPPLFSRHIIDVLIESKLIKKDDYNNLYLTKEGLKLFLELQRWKEEKAHNFVIRLYFLTIGAITVLNIMFNNNINAQQKINIFLYAGFFILLFVLIYAGWVEPISKKVERLRGGKK